ncbi:MAG TPA: hypothetical protein VL331_08655 [Croceibacterium sp.]|jgi:hypothetical protein|nr:hypothetical protein [Croceibacterium sp.]
MAETDGAPAPAPKKGKKTESAEDKEQRRLRMRERLLNDVAASVADDLRGKVAYVLNHYPDTRDSDTVLLIRLWSTFHPDYVAGRSVSFDDLAKLPSAQSVSRWRAKIQNEYRLYQASDAVAEYRRSLRKDKKDEMVLAKPGPPLISIYSDESGKAERYLVVGSAWTTSIARIYLIEQDLR